MCLILLAWRAHVHYPLIFAGNRDEAYERPSLPADFWHDAPDVYGGRDMDKGGTWLGIHRSGRFAAITNFRDGPARKPAPRSRGELTADFLRGVDPPSTYLRDIRSRAALYGGFTLLAGNLAELWAYSNRGGGPVALAPGVHGVSNHLLNTPWPKIVAGKRRVAALLEASEAGLIESLFDALTDRTIAPDAELPDTGVGAERERELSPAFIAGERYGTRASTVLLVDRDNTVLFVERRFGPRGANLGNSTRRFTLQACASAGA